MKDDVKDIIEEGIVSFQKVIEKIRELAASSDWRERENAATALAEISRKNESEVIKEMMK